MLVQVNTDNHIPGNDELAGKVASEMERSLKRFATQITRVEVHLNDENGDKAGADDKRCLLEARIKGLDPVVVRHNAPTITEAVKGATDKLVRTLNRSLTKRSHPKGSDPFATEASL
jgi:ribosome-associated translation inhibitor RaiA